MNQTISRKCHLVIFRLYFIASIGSNHLSITAYKTKVNLTETIIHGIMRIKNHSMMNIEVKIAHRTPFRILSRVIQSQKFFTLASIQLIKSIVNDNIQMLKIMDKMFVMKFGIKLSHSIHNISHRTLSRIQIPK